MHGLEQRGDDIAVVFGAEVDEFDGGFEVVEEAVDVGEEDFDVAACAEEVGEFDDGDEVTAVRSAGGCCACFAVLKTLVRKMI